MGEIAAASNEQAQGIEQVNKAVTEMDRVVQLNAASAEESASASEEMYAQAEQMKVFVGDLVGLVAGHSNRNGMDDEKPDRRLMSGAIPKPTAKITYKNKAKSNEVAVLSA